MYHFAFRRVENDAEAIGNAVVRLKKAGGHGAQCELGVAVDLNQLCLLQQAVLLQLDFNQSERQARAVLCTHTEQ